MRKILAGILASSMVIGTFSAIIGATSQDNTVYVSISGISSAAGTENAPVADIGEALELAVAKSEKTADDIVINIKSGEYEITEPIKITEAYNHKNGGRIVIRGAEDGSSVISGGECVSEWSEHDTNIWKANINASDIRQLWINGESAQRARNDGTILTAGIYDDASTESVNDGILLPANTLPVDLVGDEGVEVVYDLLWTRQRLAVEEIVSNGDNLAFKMKQPYYSYLLQKENYDTIPNHEKYKDPNLPDQFDYCYVENAYSLLDSENEFYYDKSSKTLYYYSETKPENAVAGVSEGIFNIEGSSSDAKVKNITVENLTMRYGTWLAPNEKGVAWMQGDYIVSENGIYVMGNAENPRGERTASQIYVKWAEGIEISDNIIEDIGSAAIDMQQGVRQSCITGNTISDTSAGAIIIGDWNHVFDSENPKMCRDLVVSGNTITDIAYEYAATPAVSIYYANGVDVINNTIKNTAYSGISAGWGWMAQKPAASGGHFVANNRIENCVTMLNDGGNIYTLGDLNHTVLYQNYIIKSNDLNEGVRGGIYLDAGTANLTIEDNVVVDSKAWLNAGQNKGISGIKVTGNFSDVSEKSPCGVEIENHTICSDKDFSEYEKAIDIMNIAGVTAPFEGDKDINVVFLGGSITYGTGATNTDLSWASKVGAYIENTYEKDGVSVTNHNVGLPGTGSDMGLLRLKKDVISKNPDMVFVEFAVNDGGSEESLRNMESIILTLQQMDKIPYVVFVLSANKSLTVATDNHKAVAEHYGIPVVDLQSIIKADENADIETMLADGVHPNDSGYAYYADKIQSALEDSAYARPLLRLEKLDYDSCAMWGVFTEAADTVSSGFEVNGSSLVSNTAGSTIEFDFVGDTLGIQDRIYTNGGDYRIDIDGKTVATRSTFYQRASQTALGYVSFDLPNGKHTLKLTTTNDSQVTIEGIYSKDAALAEEFNAGIFEKFVPYEGNVPEFNVTIPPNNTSWTNDYLGIKDMGTYWLHGFTYTSEYLDGETNTCYAVAAYPKAAGTYPGALVLHGGGQKAQSPLNEVKALAQAGYVVIAPELPGIASRLDTDTPNSSGAWKTAERDSDHNPYVREPYQAVVAAIQALHLLQSSEFIIDASGAKYGVTVDIENIGVEGASWGGYTTTMLAGIMQDQIDAAYSYFGSGFYEISSWWSDYMKTMSEEKLEYWIENLDAGRRAKNITAPYFIAAATNDDYFHPPAVNATLAEVPGVSGVLYSPNTNHHIVVGGSNIGTGMAPEDTTYFDYYLKGIGAPPATVMLKNKGMTENGYEVSFKTESRVSISDAKAYYSTHTDTWTDRVWTELEVTQDLDGYTAILPNTNEKQDVYLLVTDANGVSSSSIIYTVIDEDTVEYIDISATESTKIEAEDYASANFTTTGVSGNIVSFNWGENLDYGINIPTDGTYEIKVNNGAVKEGNGIAVLVDGDKVIENGKIAVTGSFTAYDTSSLGTVELTAGNHILRLSASADMQLDYITIQKVVKTSFRLEAENNDGSNAVIGTATKNTTVHNSNQYIDWKVNIEKAGIYEFKLNAYGYNKPSRPIIKVNGVTVIECGEITSDATACVEHTVGNAALNKGENTITLYNPTNAYFTDGNTSSSMFVDWMEITRVSGITSHLLQVEDNDGAEGFRDDGSVYAIWHGSGKVKWNVDISESGNYKVILRAASGGLAADGKYAKPTVYVDGAAILTDTSIPGTNYATYAEHELGIMGLSSGTHEIMIENKQSVSASFLADYMKLERVSGITKHVLQFEAAPNYDFGSGKIQGTTVQFFNTASWAEWTIDTDGGEHEFILRTGSGGKVAKPVIFIDGEFAVQPEIPATENYALADVTVYKAYLTTGKHTVKVYNPQNAGTGENADSKYESSATVVADSLVINKVSDMGITSQKITGELTAMANTENHDGAELYIGVYNGNTLVAVYKADGIGEIEKQFTLDNESYTIKLMLWNEMNPVEEVNVY